MFPFQRILVALAAADTDAGLLAYAARVASLCSGAEIRCVHVAAPGDTAARMSELEDCVRSRASSFGDNLLAFHRASGDRVDGLLEFALTHRSDLILLGHRFGHAPRRSLARRLAMKAPCSVWMAPADAKPGISRILAPVDFSRRAADALQVATSIGAAAGLDEAHALHVHFNDAAATYDEYEEIVADREDRAFLLFLAPIDLHGLHVKPLWVEGASVAHTILRVAEEKGADLVVMGTRGRSRSAAVLLGSETEHVLMETHVPVLAVKHFGARMRLTQALLDRRVRERGDSRFT